MYVTRTQPPGLTGMVSPPAGPKVKKRRVWSHQGSHGGGGTTSEITQSGSLLRRNASSTSGSAASRRPASAVALSPTGTWKRYWPPGLVLNSIARRSRPLTREANWSIRAADSTVRLFRPTPSHAHHVKPNGNGCPPAVGIRHRCGGSGMVSRNPRSVSTSSDVGHQLTWNVESGAVTANRRNAESG